MKEILHVNDDCNNLQVSDVCSVIDSLEFYTEDIRSSMKNFLESLGLYLDMGNIMDQTIEDVARVLNLNRFKSIREEVEEGVTVLGTVDLFPSFQHIAHVVNRSLISNSPEELKKIIVDIGRFHFRTISDFFDKYPDDRPINSTYTDVGSIEIPENIAQYLDTIEGPGGKEKSFISRKRNNFAYVDLPRAKRSDCDTTETYIFTFIVGGQKIEKDVQVKRVVPSLAVC